LDEIERIQLFLKKTIAPCFEEVASAPRLKQDFTIQIVEGGLSDDRLLNQMIAELREGSEEDDSLLYGQTLVIEERDESKKRPHFAGRFLVSPLVRIAGDDIYASPTALFQMKFDGKLHKFMHRYDNDVENHRIEDVTRPHVLNHVLNSFTFYRMHAFSDQRPW
jgi:hypothetical protein